MNILSLIDIDHMLLQWFNGSDSLFVDSMVMLLTSALTWLPLYVALFFMVVKNNETMIQIFLILGGALLCVIMTSGIDNLIIKPLVARPRPSLDPTLKYVIDIVDNYRHSSYSFFSAHAGNTMSLAVFFCWVVRSRLLSVTLILWSLVNGWTRLYLGVHYPSDVAAGFLWGIVCGTAIYFLYRYLYKKVTPPINYISSQYTKTGFAISDVNMVMTVMSLTLACVMIAALF